MIEPITNSLKLLERITIRTPLGIRFWDPTRDAQVSDGLTVTARLSGLHHAATRAFCTPSGIYAFQGLPGLHDVEYPTGDLVPTENLLATTRYLVQVFDDLGRFLPVVFGVDLPYQGVFPTETINSPFGHGPPGFYLFSAPTRPGTPALAIVRALLEEPVDETTRRPAAHAVLEIYAPGQDTWYGVADERGCVVVLFPYPTFSDAAGGSSPVASPPTECQQRWDVNVRVRYDPAALTVPTGFQVPDLRSIFDQAPGAILSSLIPLSWLLIPSAESGGEDRGVLIRAWTLSTTAAQVGN